MGLMKMGGVTLFLMAFFTAAAVEARFDPNNFLVWMMNGDGGPNYFVKSTTTACCDNCSCTKSIPPQCHCRDVGTTCHSACKACFCTRSIPPQCRCADTTNFCYSKCRVPNPAAN